MPEVGIECFFCRVSFGYYSSHAAFCRIEINVKIIPPHTTHKKRNVKRSHGLFQSCYAFFGWSFGTGIFICA